MFPVGGVQKHKSLWVPYPTILPLNRLKLNLIFVKNKTHFNYHQVKTEGQNINKVAILIINKILLLMVLSNQANHIKRLKVCLWVINKSLIGLLKQVSFQKWLECVENVVSLMWSRPKIMALLTAEFCAYDHDYPGNQPKLPKFTVLWLVPH